MMWMKRVNLWRSSIQRIQEVHPMLRSFFYKD